MYNIAACMKFALKSFTLNPVKQNISSAQLVSLLNFFLSSLKFFQ